MKEEKKFSIAHKKFVRRTNLETCFIYIMRFLILILYKGVFNYG